MNDKIIIGISLGLGALGIGFGVKACYEMKKLSDKVGLSIETLSRSTNVEIEDSMIANAVRHAVDRESGRAVAAAVRTVVNDTQKEIRKDVADGVKQVYTDLKSVLTKEVYKQVGEIDISEIREEALEKAQETAAEKLNASMDDILNKFNADLRNVSKIYNSIASMMGSGSSNSKEVTFRIG